MNLQHYYWYFTKVLSDKQCDDIIRHAKTKKESEAVIGVYTKKDLEDIKKDKDRYKKYKKQLSEVRKSNIVWLDDKWIYNLIHPYIHIANKNAVGIFNGIGQNLANLQFTIKINFMTGITMMIPFHIEVKI